MSRLKGFFTAVAESNQNYNIDKYYDIKQLIGKLVGGLFRREEYEPQTGERKWTTKLAWTCSASKIRNGEFTIPDEKPLPEKDNVMYGAFPQAPANPYASSPIAQDDPFAGNQGFMPIDNEIEGEEDLPF